MRLKFCLSRMVEEWNENSVVVDNRRVKSFNVLQEREIRFSNLKMILQFVGTRTFDHRTFDHRAINHRTIDHCGREIIIINKN